MASQLSLPGHHPTTRGHAASTHLKVSHERLQVAETRLEGRQRRVKEGEVDGLGQLNKRAEARGGLYSVSQCSSCSSVSVSTSSVFAAAGVGSSRKASVHHGNRQRAVGTVADQGRLKVDLECVPVRHREQCVATNSWGSL